MLTYAADSSEAVTSGRALVLVNVALPMTLVQFKQQEVLASGNISCSNNMMWRIASSSMRQLLRQLASAYVSIRVVAAPNIAASNLLACGNISCSNNIMWRITPHNVVTATNH
jgi:hypothetical protein